jgi:CDGSH-type Zn-finger protein
MTIEIQVFDNGPFLVKGADIVLKDANGDAWNTEGKDAVALCRCGASANKPFCDGGHKGAGFEDTCKAS